MSFNALGSDCKGGLEAIRGEEELLQVILTDREERSQVERPTQLLALLGPARRLRPVPARTRRLG